MKKITSGLTSILLGLPASAFALTITPPCETSNCSSATDVATLLQTIINWVLGFAALIAVLFLIFGGVIYIASTGNKERAEQAKKTILYSVIGLVVIVLSYFIVRLVISLTTGAATGKL